MGVAIRPGRLSIAAAYAALDDPASGGVVLFVGRVRDERRPRGRVRALLYESDPRIAEAQLAAIERRAVHRFGLRRSVLWHRTGELPVGEIAVLVGAAAAHRAAAFDAAEYLIDTLKERAAIWKTDLLERRGGTRRRRRPGLRRPRVVK